VAPEARAAREPAALPGDYPALAALYEAKQRLNELLLLKNLRKKTARKKLPELLELIEQLRHSPLSAWPRP
jgi:hypothetical protein